jgi:hypothetical protein
MFLTRKQLSRRALLRGAGTAIGLPFLDAMVPALAAPSATPKPPVRLTFVYVPNGIVMEKWTPSTVGSSFELPPILKPLEPFRSHSTVISGLMNYNANAFGDGGGAHARGGAAYLTATHPKKTGGYDIRAGVSIDQEIAQAIGAQTRLPSLELGLDDNRIVGHCDSGYSCAYTNSISWRGPSTPLPPEANPRAVFERLFGDIDTSIDEATRARRAAYRRSVLDMVGEETRRLAGSLGPSDRRKIDEYLDSVREVEKRIQAQESGPTVEPPVDKPAGIPSDFLTHASLLFDLQTIAFQADLTRVTTMMIGREGSARTYAEIGVPDPHHPLSHHRGDKAAIEKLERINAYHMELFAKFLAKLSGLREQNGSLLDHSMIVYGCGIADSDRHTHTRLPLVLVGGGGGTLQGGRHLDLGKDTPLANLYLALAERMGVQRDAFGDSSGKLDL